MNCPDLSPTLPRASVSPWLDEGLGHCGEPGPPRAHWRRLWITVTVTVDAIRCWAAPWWAGWEEQWLPLPGPGLWDPSPDPVHHPGVSPPLFMGLPQMDDVPLFFFFYLMYKCDLSSRIEWEGHLPCSGLATSINLAKGHIHSFSEAASPGPQADS